MGGYREMEGGIFVEVFLLAGTNQPFFPLHLYLCLLFSLSSAGGGFCFLKRFSGKWNSFTQRPQR